MQVRIASLDGALAAGGTAVIIDVYRAFSTAAVALSRGARRIVMVDDLERALALREAGIGDLCIGERGGRRPAGFDFGNSPAAMMRAELAGRTLILTTSNGTKGINAAAEAGTEKIYAGALVSAEATVQAILRDASDRVSLVAMGREGLERADEDELCALYLRSRLEGRHPDGDALRTLLLGMAPPVHPGLLASGDVDPQDREIASRVDLVDFAVEVRREDGLLIAEASR